MESPGDSLQSIRWRHEAERDALNDFSATIKVVPEDEIRKICWILEAIEKANELRELAVDIADKCDWRRELEQRRLIEESALGGA
jgi:hypothetical protein